MLSVYAVIAHIRIALVQSIKLPCVVVPMLCHVFDGPVKTPRAACIPGVLAVAYVLTPPDVMLSSRSIWREAYIHFDGAMCDGAGSFGTGVSQGGSFSGFIFKLSHYPILPALGCTEAI